MTDIQAAIVIPTLDPVRAGFMGARAAELGGVPATVIVVGDPIRRGGIAPANAGFRAALELGTPFIVYLNDDAGTSQVGWLARMIEALQSNPTYGIAAPSGRCRGGPQNADEPLKEHGVVVVDKPLAWFCAVIRREVMVQVGTFDPALHHYCGDSDLTFRAQAAGWKSIWVKDVFFSHHPTEPIAEWWKVDTEYRKAKWKR